MISSHVLDTALGRPARDLAVHLDVLQGAADASGVDAWRRIASAQTNQDGRVTGLADATTLRGQTCRLSFETAAYFAGGGRPIFFPRIDVIFALGTAADRYHIPLLLSPFGYSTYRGS